MRKWIANKDFLMEDIINYVTPERDYLVVRLVKAGSFIYEYENIDKIVVNRYSVIGNISQSWKDNCSLLSIEPETEWGETGGTGGDSSDSDVHGGNMTSTYVGTDVPGTGSNILDIGKSHIWYNPETEKAMLVSRVTIDKYVQVELNW